LTITKEKKIKDRLFPDDKEGIDKDAYTFLADSINHLKLSVEESHKKNDILTKNLRDLAKDGLHHMQKISLKRYNPYGDTGGDQSFTLVLLTANLDGQLITSLHSRSGTRVYAKGVKNGKSDIELSKEEKEALEEANE
jgi:hypothetical protein